MARNEMIHVLSLYNQDLAIFADALAAEGSSSAMFLLHRIEEKGAGKHLLSHFDLTLIYNGLSKLEMEGIEHKRSEEAALLMRKTNSIYPTISWGSDPVGRFRNWQKWILERV